MSPESKCDQCGKDFSASTREELIALELAHYLNSSSPNLAGREAHHCFGFIILDSQNRVSGCHTFGHGRFDQINSWELDGKEIIDKLL